jgi:hypothetical protein
VKTGKQDRKKVEKPRYAMLFVEFGWLRAKGPMVKFLQILWVKFRAELRGIKPTPSNKKLLAP